MIKVNGKTKIYAVLGNPIGHTLSPAMYNAAFAALGMNSVYVALEVVKGQLADAVRGLKALGIQGGNVTIPFKEAIIPYLDGITEEARLMGAVNAFYWEKGQLWGDNTDGAGFIRALQKKSAKVFWDQGAVLWGAGGAARAVAVALAKVGMKKLLIVNRHRERGEKLAALLTELGVTVRVSDGQDGDLGEAFCAKQLLINTTPLGMSPYEKECPPVKEDWLRKEMLVVDLIYQPRETLLLQKAQARGCQTLNGLAMLLEQGILSFERWAGQPAPIEVMTGEKER